MTEETILLSEKYRDFMELQAPVEFLEGTTAAGKTTVGCLKFMFQVAGSPKKMHILSGLDLGTIEKNILNKDLGILDMFGDRVTYSPGGKGKNSLPHLILHQGAEDKIIYVLGYDNKTRWKKALGGQYGCLYIDEINIADMDYIREVVMRCDYLMATLNPDDPNLPVYAEFINNSRPLAKWAHETPTEILEQLDRGPKEGWVHWFFSFKDNLSLTQEKLAQIVNNVPVGTKLYKNKIQGLRGRATGLVFANFDRRKHVLTKEQLDRWMQENGLHFERFTCGVDTAYSDKSPDVMAFIFQGITQRGHLVTLEEEIYNNANLDEPLAPSDVVVRLNDFLDRMRSKWGFARDVFVDSADQATLTELNKHRKRRGSLHSFINAYKKMNVIDRLHLQLGWIAAGYYFVLDTCRYHIQEMEAYSWKSDKYEPEDMNDHTINAGQYAWIPYKNIIGERGIVAGGGKGDKS